MIVKTRSLTESLNKLYEAYEVELEDELDAIMDDDTLSDEEKEEEINKALDKHDELNESFVEEWWGQTDEDPFDFAYEYGLTCKALGSEGDETLYRFTGEKEDFDQAIKDGYFFSLDYGADEGHSEDLNESFTLNEAENPDNAEINALIRKVVGRKNISKKDAQALADAGIERDENGDLTGKNGRRLVKWGTAIHGPSQTYLKRPRQRGEDVPAWRKTGKDNTVTRWDLRKNSSDYYGSKHADKWDKVDLKNYLDSEKPHNEWETEQEIDKKLRPYSDKYQELKDRRDTAARWAAREDEYINSEEDIEKLVQEYRDKLMKERQHRIKAKEDEEGSKEFYDKQIKDIQAQAKAKHPQYESLNEASHARKSLTAVVADVFKGTRFTNVKVTKERGGVRVDFDTPEKPLSEQTADSLAQRIELISRDSRISVYPDVVGDNYVIFDVSYMTESLNEAQLNENPLIAAAARAAIPAAINVASNAISSAIDAKLHDGNNLEEDFYDPTSWFYDLVNNYETWSGEEWNSWSQEERDAAVTKAMKHFLIDNQLSEEEAEEFKHDLADNNFHTECRIFSELYGII